MRDTFVQEVKRYLQTNRESFFLTADLGFGIFDDFPNLFPNQFFNVGVAEQLMASLSCGLSLSGDKVFIYSIGIFPTVRCLEQVRNDICYHNSNVMIITSGAGFSYGSLGISHHCTEDISILRCLPNLRICSPASELEAKTCIPLLLKMNSPSYLRLDKWNSTVLTFRQTSEYGPFIYSQPPNSSVLLLAHGSTLDIYKNFIDIYDNSLPNISIASVPFLIESIELNQLLLSHDLIITTEEHQISGGFGSFISEQMNKCGSKAKLLIYGLSGFSDIVGSQSYLRNLYLPTSDGIYEIIKSNKQTLS
tara:strand:- start:4371 stop:5288 length:918 start_codon:yes stop_codon:yes gene_type:complete